MRPFYGRLFGLHIQDPNLGVVMRLLLLIIASFSRAFESHTAPSLQVWLRVSAIAVVVSWTRCLPTVSPKAPEYCA